MKSLNPYFNSLRQVLEAERAPGGLQASTKQSQTSVYFLRELEKSLLSSNSRDNCIHLLPIFPSLVGTVVKLLSSSISPEQCSFVHVEKVFSTIAVFNAAMQKLLLSSEIEGAIASINDAEVITRIIQIMLLLTGTLEVTKDQQQKNLKSFDESLPLSCFKCYNLILRIWRHLWVRETPRSLTGPFLAQIIQTSLFFTRSSNLKATGCSIIFLHFSIENI